MSVDCDKLESIVFKGSNFVNAPFVLTDLPGLKKLEVCDTSFSNCPSIRLESGYHSIVSQIDLRSVSDIWIGPSSLSGCIRSDLETIILKSKGCFCIMQT